MPWLAKSLGPWDWVMRRLFLFFLVQSTMQRIGLPSVRSPAVSLPMQDNPPEDLSLRLLDSVHVGPTAGGRSLKDETWKARRALHTLWAKVRSTHIRICYRPSNHCRTTIEPQVYIEGRRLAAVKTQSGGRNNYCISPAIASETGLVV